MKEIWKDIEGFENLYAISNLGRVKSLPKNYRGIYRDEYIMKLTKDRNGYMCINLNIKNSRKRKFKLIHRLVAIHFLNNFGNKKEVNHIDGIKSNNNVNNLEWCTRSENQLHAFKCGLDKPKKGELNGNSKLTWECIKFIREAKINKSHNGRQLAKLYNISTSNISSIQKNKIWKE